MTVFDSIKPLGKGKFCPVIYCDSVSVLANQKACRAYFLTFSNSGVNDSMWIVNRSSGENFKYTWDFGDGTTSSLPYPSHYYNKTGSYEVCLKVRDTINNCENMYCDTVKVNGQLNIQVVGDIDSSGGNTTISDKIENFYLDVYPNPFDNQMSLLINNNDNKLVKWRLVELDGREILNGGSNLQNKVITIDTEKVSSGLYILQVFIGNRVITKKVFCVNF